MKSAKRFLSVMLVLAMCFALAVPAMAADETASETTEFVVLSTTDVHGKCWDTNVLNDTSVSNSLLRVSTAVKSIRETYGEENVLLIDNGDLFQGTPVSSYQISQLTKYLSTGSTEGLDENLLNEDGSFMTTNPMALCLEEIGYDTFVLGNHEFNYSWDTMQSIYAELEEAGIPVLAANLYYEDGSNAFGTYITKEISVGGQTFTIGILGMENTDCTRWDVADNYPGISFALDSAAQAQAYVDQMQAEGCDFIILAYHSGLGSSDDSELEPGSNTENQVLRVIENTTGIDMVISGHDHSTGYSNSSYENADGESVLVVNAGGSTMTQSVFSASLDANGELQVTLQSSENLNLSAYEDDEELKALIAPYAAAAENYTNQECGTLTGEWDTVSQSDCYLEQSDTIDLINRAQIVMGSQYIAEKYDTEEAVQELYDETGLDHLDIDLSSTSIVFSGDYPASAGELTMKKIYQFYKYDNTLYVIPVTGAEIKEILEFNAASRLSSAVKNGEVIYQTIGDSFTNPVFYGLDFTYDMAQEEGSRVIISGFTNGREFSEDAVYLLAVNNYHLGNVGSCFEAYSTEDAIWSQTDDLGGGVVQDLIAEYVGQLTESEGGVSPAPSNWSLTYSADVDSIQLAETAVAAPLSDTVEDGDEIVLYSVAGVAAVSCDSADGSLTMGTGIVQDNIFYGESDVAVFTVNATDDGYYTLTVDGQYLSYGVTGSGLSLEDTQAAGSLWAIEAVGDGTFRVRSAGTGTEDQYLEYYNGSISTWSGDFSSAFLFEIYKADADLTAAAQAQSQTSDSLLAQILQMFS